MAKKGLNKMVDNSERLEMFRKRAAENQAEYDRKLEGYEKVGIKGAILIDGNHMFIEVLSDIDKFNKLLPDSIHSEILGKGDIQNIWESPDPRNLAEFVAAQVVLPLSNHLCIFAADSFFPSQKSYVNTSSILNGHVSGADDLIAVEADYDVFIFDAKLPKRGDLIQYFEAEWEKFYRFKMNEERNRVQVTLDRLKEGNWELWHDDAPRVFPYDLKNGFIDCLSDEWGGPGWEAHLGTRKIKCTQFGKKTGWMWQSEKGVDTQLVITGCEVASNPSVDWVCLVTNDSDYIPLVDHLQKAGKKVFLLSFGNPKRQARDLKNSVGDKNVITKLSIFDHTGELAQYSINRILPDGAEDNPQNRKFLDQQLECPMFGTLITQCMFANDLDKL